MKSHIDRILTTEPATIIEDAVGVVVIFLLIFAGLSIPGLA